MTDDNPLRPGDPPPRPHSLFWSMGGAVVIVLGLLVVLPFGFLAFGFWATEGAWEFEPGGWRYWVFAKGSRLERVGLVEPDGRTPQYSVSLGEGTFPGWSIVSYQSKATPQAVVAAYEERCRSLGYKRVPQTEPPKDDTEAVLVCEIEPYLDVEVHAERIGGARLTDVGVKVWGSE